MGASAGSGNRRSSFDPVLVGRRECAAWAAYYRHEWATVLRSMVGMVSAGFLTNRRDTAAGAWYALQANRAWAPLPDNDPDAAREYMRRFYRVIVDSGWGVFEPARAAELEVEWWRLHRAHQYGQAETAELVTALDALYSYVYDVSEGAMRPAAQFRADAMDISDEWVRAGCALADPRLAAERRALIASYTALREGVERSLNSVGQGS
jgi:hypothetical protein